MWNSKDNKNIWVLGSLANDSLGKRSMMENGNGLGRQEYFKHLISEESEVGFDGQS